MIAAGEECGNFMVASEGLKGLIPIIQQWQGD